MTIKTGILVDDTSLFSLSGPMHDDDDDDEIDDDLTLGLMFL